MKNKRKDLQEYDYKNKANFFGTSCMTVRSDEPWTDMLDSFYNAGGVVYEIDENGKVLKAYKKQGHDRGAFTYE